MNSYLFTKVQPLDPTNIVFPGLGIDINVDKDAFFIGDLAIKWYGLIIMTGLILALLYCFKRMKSFGISSDRAFDAVFAGFFGALIGARLYYVAFQWDQYKDNPIEILAFRDGGLAIYGGLIGALLVGCTVAKIRKVKLLPLLDLAGLGFLIGQGVGRWGNFFNHECFGVNTDNIFGMSSGRIQSFLAANADRIFDETGLVIDPYSTVHPCFLYESFLCLLGFLILHLYSKHRKFDGEIFLMYLGWYGLVRFFIEGLRTDSLMIGHIRVSQLLAAICFVTAISLIIGIRIHIRRMGDYVFYKDTEESKKFIEEQEAAEAEEKRKKAEKKAKKSSESEELRPEDKIVDENDDNNEKENDENGSSN